MSISNAAVPDFEARVDALIPRLAGGEPAAKEREVALKRLAWLEQRGLSRPPGWPEPALPLSPRAAFELLFFEYMGLTPEQVPVVEEDDSRITWLSANRCPALEACARLGLDTRVVCRAVYERPTQAFLSQLDPNLRFVRDYSALRPHAPHCRESIVRVDLQDLMRQPIVEAQAARAEGNKGYGAVLVWDSRHGRPGTDTHHAACCRGSRSGPRLHGGHRRSAQGRVHSRVRLAAPPASRPAAPPGLAYSRPRSLSRYSVTAAASVRKIHVRFASSVSRRVNRKPGCGV